MSQLYEQSYGDVLRELRIYHGYRQKNLSEYLNITSQAYSNYENNKRTPDIDTIYRIAQFYNISVDKLINYRFSGSFEETRNYGSLYRAVGENGISIPLNAKQAKMVNELISLSDENQDTCQNFISFLKGSSEQP